MQLSPSQLTIIALATSPESNREGDLITVPAVAGSGKSLLIVEIARRMATAKILFLAQSRNVTDRAKNTLPKNVTVMTVYEIASQHVRLSYREKLSGPGVLSYLSRLQLQEMLTGVTSEELDRGLYILQRFYNASGGTPELHHIPKPKGKEDWRHNKLQAKKALQVARDIWFSQRSHDSKSLPLTFDAVIKLWTLSSPESVRFDNSSRMQTVSPLGNHDLIVLEEAQDSSEALLDFLARQPCSIITFSDSYQALSQSNLAIQQLRHPLQQRAESFFMGESWRYGPPVASILNALTHKAGYPQPQRITGCGQSVVYDTSQCGEWEKHDVHYTLIADQHRSLFEAAYKASCADKEIAWIDGIMSYPVRLLLDLAILDERINVRRLSVEDARIERDWVRQCSSVEIARRQALSRRDHSTAALCDFVQTHRGEPLVEMIQSWISKDADRQHQMLIDWRKAPPRDITLTTVRRSKGHEFPRVAIADDLVPVSLLLAWKVDYAAQRSINRLYTAISRTQFEIALPLHLLAHLDEHQWQITANGKHTIADVDTDQQIHPYFGVHRHSLLEMAPGNRLKRQTHEPKQLRKRLSSGQDAIKRRMEEGAHLLTGSSMAELRKAVGLRSRRTKE